MASLSIYSALFAMTLTSIIRHLFFHPRPFMLKLGTQLIQHAPTSSFPSAHTTFMLSIALIWLYFRDSRKIGILLCLVGLMGGLARVFCGIHFPLDIVGSFLVALSTSSLVFICRGWLERLNGWIAAKSRSLRGCLGFKVIEK
ncbi:phosphatase PAP2 family protein [Dongshaea marina]|uniref:phosphatase PAP2 family protein n=1 Tax=Dongshaea marina TaxID=2047966 RepID=UPI001F322654|nr:phosphatase PAP2 family protein [Dongshaea marina]